MTAWVAFDAVFLAAVAVALALLGAGDFLARRRGLLGGRLRAGGGLLGRSWWSCRPASSWSSPWPWWSWPPRWWPWSTPGGGSGRRASRRAWPGRRRCSVTVATLSSTSAWTLPAAPGLGLELGDARLDGLAAGLGVLGSASTRALTT